MNVIFIRLYKFCFSYNYLFLCCIYKLFSYEYYKIRCGRNYSKTKFLKYRTNHKLEKTNIKRKKTISYGPQLFQSYDSSVKEKIGIEVMIIKLCDLFPLTQITQFQELFPKETLLKLINHQLCKLNISNFGLLSFIINFAIV